MTAKARGRVKVADSVDEQLPLLMVPAYICMISFLADVFRVLL